MGDTLPRPHVGSLPIDWMRRRSQPPHPTPTRRAPTRAHVSAGDARVRRASQRPHATTWGKTVAHVVPGTWALAPSTKAPAPSRRKSRSWTGSAGRHDGHSWRTRSPPTTKHPRICRTCKGLPAGRVRTREGVSVGVDGKRPHARCAAPSSGTNNPFSTAPHATLHLHTTFGLPWGGGSHPRVVRARSYRRAYERKGCPYAPRVNPVDHK